MKKTIIILLVILPFFVFSQKKEETIFTYKGVEASVGYFDEEYSKYVWEKTYDSLNIPITFDYKNRKIYIEGQEEFVYLVYGAEKISEDEKGVIFEFSCIIKNEKVKITNYLPLKDDYNHMLIIDYQKFTLKYILEDYKTYQKKTNKQNINF
jgi:hypothetical protein